MKVAALFHFSKHTESLSVNTDKISLLLKQKINEAILSNDRVSISLDSFNQIKKLSSKKGFKKHEKIVGINVLHP